MERDTEKQIKNWKKRRRRDEEERKERERGKDGEKTLNIRKKGGELKK